MSDWIDLVPKQDKERYPQLYGEYFRALPDDIEVTSISGSNPGYYGLGGSSRVYIKNALGEKAVMQLSADNQTFIDCPSNASDDVRGKWKELEAQLPERVEKERLKLFKIASYGIFRSKTNESMDGNERAYSQNPWVAFTLRNLHDVYVRDLLLCEGGIVKASFENAEHKMLLECSFQKSGGFEIESTRIKTDRYLQNQRNCRQTFVESAEEIVKRTRGFVEISDWHGLSLQSQHVLGKDDWLLPLAIGLKEQKIKIEDLWVALDSTGCTRHWLNLSLMPNHALHQEALDDKEGPRGRIVCDRDYGYGRDSIEVKPLVNGAYAVQRAVRAGFNHLIR